MSEGQMNNFSLCTSMLFEVDKGPNKNGRGAGFGPRLPFEKAWCIVFGLDNKIAKISDGLNRGDASNSNGLLCISCYRIWTFWHLFKRRFQKKDKKWDDTGRRRKMKWQRMGEGILIQHWETGNFTVSYNISTDNSSIVLLSYQWMK